MRRHRVTPATLQTPGGQAEPCLEEFDMTTTTQEQRARKRLNRMGRFGRRYAIAKRDDHTGHDWRMQAVKAAARIAGPLSWEDITTVIAEFGHAERGES
jgi:hypothetical protein